jgi:anti-repressor protein
MITQTASDFAHLVFNSIMYESSVIKTFGTCDELWFCGKDIAKILGYENTRKAIIDNVDKDDKNTLELLLNKIEHKNTRKYNKNDLKTIYINKRGLICLLT